MRFDNLLKQRESTIRERWLNLTLDTYPADSFAFLKNQKNQFLNPVGNTISRELDVLYQSLVNEVDPKAVTTSLDSILRIRSIQEFSPSQAVSFIILLKSVIREELDSELQTREQFTDLQKFELRIDQLAMQGFDVYSKCRERLFEVRLNELRRTESTIVARLNRNDRQPEHEDDI